MKKILFTMAVASLIGGVQAQEANEENPAAERGAIAAAEGAPAGAKAVDVVKALAGQLIVADGEKLKAAGLEEGMEYYLVYHSASW